MINLIGQKFNRLLVLEKTEQREYGSIVWKCQCDCGNITYVSSRSLKSNNTKSCGCLNKEKQIERIQQYNRENKKYHSGDKIGIFTLIQETPYRKDSNIIWECQCQCGEKVYLDTNKFTQEKLIFCQHKYKYSLYPYNNLTNQRFGKLIALNSTTMRKHNNIIWECICDCGNICYKTTSSLLNGSVQSCGCLKSKGEEQIIRILQINNIDFVTQYHFNDCKKNNFYLYFDFYINNKYLLEYDGIQHFIQTGWEDLSIIQNRDKIKNEWCKEHNIPLIRIPYTHYNNLCLEDLLLETSQFVIN